MTGIVPRATVDQLVAHRDRALTLYGIAHEKLVEAYDALMAARRAGIEASPGRNRFNHHQENERRAFLGVIDVPERGEFIETARRLTDTDVWSHIVALTDLQRLMDKKAKDELTRQLQTDPPEVTVENVIATLETFLAQAGTIFRRGIAECFSDLDRRFRSHDGWKIGSRVILSFAFDGYGRWNYHRNHRDTLTDIERTFLVLDGVEPPPDYAGIIGLLEARRGWGAHQTFVENSYFRVRAFKNGNAHIWFKRDDLVEKVNKLLGEYYGAPIPEDREPDVDTGLDNPKTALAKNYGFFPTPDAAARQLLHYLPLYRQEDAPRVTVLEPSAGTGNLSALLARHENGDARHGATWRACEVDVVEVQAPLAAALRASGLYRRVVHADFLAVMPDPANLYDVIAMNPPFDRERDIDHVMHALKFLKPSGCLAAIMSAGTEFRETRKAYGFRELMKSMNAGWEDLPAGSFAEAGTYCNTIILRVRKDGRHPSYY